MAWRDAVAALGAATVRAFDHGSVSFQKMAGGSPVGAPLPLPAIYVAAFLEVAPGERVKGAGRTSTLEVHYGDFPPDVRPEADDRMIVADGPAAGTWVIDAAEDIEDRTGAVLSLRKATLRG